MSSFSRLALSPDDLRAKVPPDIVSVPQWVTWGGHPDAKADPKKMKEPVDPKTGRAAHADKPDTWGTFDVALAWHAAHPDSLGVGFEFAPPYAGVDLDHCVVDGVVEPWAQAIMDRIASYSEFSPSGTGVHILVKLDKPFPKGRKFTDYPMRGRAVEMYCRGRYFTVTGNRVASSPPSIQDRTDDVLALYAELMAWRESKRDAKKGSASARVERASLTMGDQEVVRRAQRSKSGAKFSQLYRGEWGTLFGSQSEADVALCSMLAFWCGPGGHEQVDRVFRSSGLMREKWEREDYRTDTLKVAFTRDEFYTPGRSKAEEPSASVETAPSENVTTEVEEMSEQEKMTALGRIFVAGKLADKDPMEVVAILGADEEAKRAVAFLRMFDTPAFVGWFGSLRPRGMARYVLQVLATVDIPKPPNDGKRDHSEMLLRSLDGIAKGKRASIKLSDGDFERQLDESIEALRAENRDRLSVLKFGDALFCRGDVIVRISDAADVPVPHIVTAERLRNRLANCACYYTERMGEEGPQAVREYPPRDIAVAILHRHAVGFPELEAVVSHPVVVLEADGSPRCVTKIGYDSTSKLLLHGFDGDALPQRATKEEGVESLRWIRTEVLCDFPFAGPAELAHAYALIFLPFVRRMIHGCTPLHLIEGSKQGAGKGLLNDVCASFSIARAARAAISPSRDDEEWRKRITMVFGTAAEMVTIDNMTGKVDSPTLAALLTLEDWTDRVLGTSDPVRYPNRIVWTATANNLTLDEDTARRCVRIRIEPQCENPSMRNDFHQDNLGVWVYENHATCLMRAWTCVIAWAQAGCPMVNTPPMGSFQSWSRVVGSLLAFLGVDGFLKNREDLQASSVSDSAMMDAFVHVWWERHGGTEVTSEQLLSVAEEVELSIRGDTESARRTSVCFQIKRLRGSWIDGFKVTYLPQDHKVRRTKSTFKLVRRESF